MGKIAAIRREGEHTIVESRYYPMSQVFPAERFNEIVRSHWGIENELHWRLDVIFNEDQARNRNGHCAEDLARLEPSNGSMRSKLKRAGWDNAVLAAMLAQFASPLMR